MKSSWVEKVAGGGEGSRSALPELLAVSLFRNFGQFLKISIICTGISKGVQFQHISAVFIRNI